MYILLLDYIEGKFKEKFLLLEDRSRHLYGRARRMYVTWFAETKNKEHRKCEITTAYDTASNLQGWEPQS